MFTPLVRLTLSEEHVDLALISTQIHARTHIRIYLGTYVHIHTCTCTYTRTHTHVCAAWQRSWTFLEAAWHDGPRTRGSLHANVLAATVSAHWRMHA
jgi:hypothetical protein